MATREQKLMAAGAAITIAEPALALAHTGGVGAIVGLALGAFVYHAIDDIEHMTGRELPLPARTVKEPKEAKDPGQRSLAYRMFNGKSVREERDLARITREAEQEAEELERYFDAPEPAPEPDQPGDVLPPPPTARSGKFLFSSVLAKHMPALDRIYIGSTMDGTEVYCTAKDLCHVALAGSTGGGKSSLMRMLMAQLCKAGAQVLLLNPHYTRYDIDHDEDWTPFTPYLVYDPMECRKYEVIEYYLRYVAEKLLPKRRDKYADSLPLGKPYFIVLDELPSIVREIPKAPEYLSLLLREGRKFGIFLISASQDFLVKTIGGNGSNGGSGVRDCYRTAYYAGGDPTTANALLDMPAKDIPENELGQGIVMLRCATAPQAKKAIQARVPYVDNEALYRLLGPSTYQPASAGPDTDELPAVPDVYASQSPGPGRPQSPTAAISSSYAGQDYQPRTVPAVPEIHTNALVEPFPTSPGPDGNVPGMQSQSQFVPGPNDRCLSAAQERHFIHLAERQPGQNVKEYLRLMKLGNAYAKHAGYILRKRG